MMEFENVRFLHTFVNIYISQSEINFKLGVCYERLFEMLSKCSANKKI